jgi:hypothetical protein
MAPFEMSHFKMISLRDDTTTKRLRRKAHVVPQGYGMYECIAFELTYKMKAHKDMT